MKDYTQYSVEDFIIDDDFVRWVKSSDPHLEAFWVDFMEANPAKQDEIDEAIRFLKMFADDAPQLASETIAHLQQQITDRIDIPVSAATVHEIVRARTRRTYAYAYAAAVSLIILVTAALWRLTPSVAAETDAPVSLLEPYPTSPLMEHVVPKGVRSRITLADGTQVWLNADSKMQYARDFQNGDTREVYLQGEAFFDVTPDASRPFIVHVQDVEIRVLGTAFNVKGYEEDDRIEATLVHGKISIEGNDTYDDVALAANQRAVFMKEAKGLVVENNVETDTYTSWRRGILVFDDQPLYEILPVLERTFNVTIHTDDAYALDCRFTAKISNKSLGEVLELFRTSDTIGYTIAGKDVYIKGSFCNDLP
ncbi:MAG: FecR domain-containing protein [Cyclobacteriaceae bacterium]|jgi:ferric-dicitrate binding protein FerR (iron transport regulator)|nr:FecR domain-containing protein [Cyclobacteriaceae bacterium]